MHDDGLSFLIPTYNNARTLACVVAQAEKIGRQLDGSFEIVICDDGSRDDTQAVIDQLGKRFKNIRAFRHEVNRGYGQTFRELYRSGQYPWLFLVPGDYQIDPAEVVKLWPHRSSADMIIGRRVNRQDSLRRLWQSRVYNGLVRLFFGVPTHDINSVRLMKSKIPATVSLTARSAFIDAQLTVSAYRQGFRVIEVPIRHRTDLKKTGKGGSWKTIWMTVADLFRFALALR